MRFLVLSLLCAAAHAEPRILVSEDYGTAQLPEKYRGTWWALCVGKENLVPVKVSSHPIPDDIGPTVRIDVAGCDDTVALFRGLGERAVTWATWTSRENDAHRRVEVTLGAEHLSIRLKGPSSGPQYFEIQGEKRELIRLSDKGADWQPSDWTLLWAGDLNRDGKIDLITRIAGDGDEVTLWLSGGGKLRQAATTFFGGC